MVSCGVPWLLCQGIYKELLQQMDSLQSEHGELRASVTGGSSRETALLADLVSEEEDQTAVAVLHGVLYGWCVPRPPSGQRSAVQGSAV